MSDVADIANDIADAERERILKQRPRNNPGADSATHCVDCEVERPEARRQALPGVQQCIDCRQIADELNNALTRGFGQR